MIDLILPPRCPGCAGIVDDDHRFCARCWQEMTFLGDGGCSSCSLPLGALDGLICARCLQSPPAYDDVVAAVAYGPISRRVVLRLKYARRPGLARTIAAILGTRVQFEDTLMVPVPLHRWRLWQRGFNQSAAIAHALERQANARCDTALLTRVRATPSLRGLNPGQRRVALRGAFHVRRRIDGQHILLIDDVLTTGATANGCAQALKRAGAARVTLVCWARVVADD